MILPLVMYSTLCRVEADTSRLSIPPKMSTHRMQYYEIKFEILLSLGLTELKAHICWQENVSIVLLICVTRYLYRPCPYFFCRTGYRKKASISFLFAVTIQVNDYLGAPHKWYMTLRFIFETESWDVFAT